LPYYFIKYIKNPTEELAFLAIQKYSLCLEYSENPQDKIKLAAFKK